DDAGYSLASGGAGIAHSNGIFFTAEEALISHANSARVIEEVYMPGKATAELPNGKLQSTETKLRQTDDGTLTLMSESISFEPKKR
ncbi:MAG: hypothetical protein AAF492_27760, partial [Verrucomicrobiota bacterium]